MGYTEELAREALRVYRRYATEVVERYELCPWAKGAVRDGLVRECVIVAENPSDPRESLAAIGELARTETVEVGLFIYPDLELDRLEFESFARALRERDAERHELGAVPFAMAAFHPQAAPDLNAPERLIPFLRRTPDPTLQLVRRSTLERVRGKSPQGTEFLDIHLLTPAALRQAPAPSLRERIARQNLETVLERGVSELEAVFGDIQRDRAESYARLRGAV